jgi:hypothetical protein
MRSKPDKDYDDDDLKRGSIKEKDEAAWLARIERVTTQMRKDNPGSHAQGGTRYGGYNDRLTHNCPRGRVRRSKESNYLWRD